MYFIIYKQVKFYKIDASCIKIIGYKIFLQFK